MVNVVSTIDRRILSLFILTFLCLNNFAFFHICLKKFDQDQGIFAEEINIVEAVSTINTRTVSLCTITQHAEAYIDEWASFHIALGFSELFLYDNSVNNDLAGWINQSQFFLNTNVNVIPWQGSGVQMQAYRDCASRSLVKTHTWVAFFDDDEFLVLRKHKQVVPFLTEHCQSGSIGINWFVFKFNGNSIYSPQPVTRRFVLRDNYTNQHIKSIVLLADLDMDKFGVDPHHFYLLNNTPQHDTNGHTFTGPFNPGGPTDVAVFHHYWTKSRKEFHIKVCQRGRVAVANHSDPSHKAHCNVNYGDGIIYDQEAWLQLKSLVPWYSLFDQLPFK